uniref:Uncharacterized protein n=1 Tax=Anguilla anguilla TaxID=7936 RepID=A0A0E9SWN2_ANGAN
MVTVMDTTRAVRLLFPKNSQATLDTYNASLYSYFKWNY